MKTIGLVGGIASGKSLVAKMLGDLGAGVLDGDRIGHALLANESEVQAAIRKRWGADVFRDDGTVNRSAIARRVFADGPVAADDRHFLESLLHPKIRHEFEVQLSQLAAAGKPAGVLDAAVLFEAGWNSACDFILWIDAPRDLRLERARQRGWSADQFAARECAQWPIEKKRALATYVIQNTGTEDQLRAAVQEFWQNRIAAGH